MKSVFKRLWTKLRSSYKRRRFIRKRTKAYYAALKVGPL